MINFKNPSKETPYKIFIEKYEDALHSGQRNIEAVAIASFNRELNEVQNRFVNIKFLSKNNFIFFTNYNSPKSISFNSHNQVAGIFYWSSINTQIRIKAFVDKTDTGFNKNYFAKRSANKNALAISSHQSQKISSFDEVISNFDITKKSYDRSCIDTCNP